MLLKSSRVHTKIYLKPWAYSQNIYWAIHLFFVQVENFPLAVWGGEGAEETNQHVYFKLKKYISKVQGTKVKHRT